MKQPRSPAPGPSKVKVRDDKPPIRERDQGSIKGSGINKPMVKESIPQRVARNTYGQPTPTQKT